MVFWISQKRFQIEFWKFISILRSRRAFKKKCWKFFFQIFLRKKVVFRKKSSIAKTPILRFFCKKYMLKLILLRVFWRAYEVDPTRAIEVMGLFVRQPLNFSLRNLLHFKNLLIKVNKTAWLCLLWKFKPL